LLQFVVRQTRGRIFADCFYQINRSPRKAGWEPVLVIVPKFKSLRHSRRDILYGMLFSKLMMYFISLSTAASLNKAGKTDVTTAAEGA
jgi:hypothetical protein